MSDLIGSISLAPSLACATYKVADGARAEDQKHRACSPGFNVKFGVEKWVDGHFFAYTSLSLQEYFAKPWSPVLNIKGTDAMTSDPNANIVQGIAWPNSITTAPMVEWLNGLRYGLDADKHWWVYGGAGFGFYQEPGTAPSGESDAGMGVVSGAGELGLMRLGRQITHDPKTRKIHVSKGGPRKLKILQKKCGNHIEWAYIRGVDLRRMIPFLRVGAKVYTEPFLVPDEDKQGLYRQGFTLAGFVELGIAGN